MGVRKEKESEIHDKKKERTGQSNHKGVSRLDDESSESSDPRSRVLKSQVFSPGSV